MKYPAFFLIFLSFPFKIICQSAIPGGVGKLVNTPAGASRANFMIDPTWKTFTIEAGAAWGIYSTIKGSSFYNEEWNKGYILLQDKRIAKNISLSFNIYDNQIFYLMDSQVLVLDAAVPVAEFGIYVRKEDSAEITIFRCGYPPINNNNSKTFYQVVSNNKIALLKHYNKSIVEKKNPADVPSKEFVDSETWYVYNTVENKIIPLKKNKNALKNALPQYAGIIETLTQQKKLKLKTDNEWVALFDELNNQLK